MTDVKDLSDGVCWQRRVQDPESENPSLQLLIFVPPESRWIAPTGSILLHYGKALVIIVGALCFCDLSHLDLDQAESGYVDRERD